MGVGAAKAKRADAGAKRLRAAAGGQRRRCARKHNLALAQVNVAVQLGHVQVGRRNAVPHAQNGLDQPRHAGRALQVSNVRLERTHHERRRARGRAAAGAVHRLQRLHLNGVAQRGARTVRLDEGDVLGSHAGVRQRGGQHATLRGPVGRGQAGCAAVLVHGRAQDARQRGRLQHGVDGGVALLRGFVRLRGPVARQAQHNGAAALAAHIAVRAVVKRAAAAAGGEHVDARKLGEHGVRDEGIDAGHHGQRALPCPEALHGEVERDERRGAGRVHRQRGASEAQGKADAVGSHGVRRARGGVGRAAFHQVTVVVVAQADKDANGGLFERLLVKPGTVQRLVALLEQHALVGVHLQGLPELDAKEAVVKVLQVLDKGRLMLQRGQGAAVIGRRAHGAAARQKHVPKRFHTTASGARHDAGHAQHIGRCGPTLPAGRGRGRHQRLDGPAGSGLQHGEQLPRCGLRRGIVKDEPAGQHHVKRVLQQIAKLHCADRVEAGIEKRRLCVQVGGRLAQHALEQSQHAALDCSQTARCCHILRRPEAHARPLLATLLLVRKRVKQV